VNFNSDGQRHPLLNSVSICTLVSGLASFVLGLVIRNIPTAGLVPAIASAATGLTAMLAGLCAQMVSATRAQRALIVWGIASGFIGFALGLAHGGFPH
jgi:hypothetical protein